jgi:hypothetical protein
LKGGADLSKDKRIKAQELSTYVFSTVGKLTESGSNRPSPNPVAPISSSRRCDKPERPRITRSKEG